MAILTLSNVGQSFGAFDLFSSISGSIQKGGKVGLVGPNGIGKTTLLRIIAGTENASAGDIRLAKGVRIGYLQQEAMQAFSKKENTIYEEMLTVFADVRRAELRLKEMEEAMESGAFSDALFEEYSHEQALFESGGGYDYEVRIGRVLTGLGFAKAVWDQPLAILSGGQKTRALLARLLVEQPDLLILDEPTNHLDIQAVSWLEGVLKSWDGAILVVSHDRYFLDTVAGNIWEMSRSGMEAYRGNYSHYVTQRQERWALRRQVFDTMYNKFMKELDYIKRNIARASTKNMAVGRLKRLIREVKVVQAGGMDLLNSQSWAKVVSQVSISSSKWEVPDVESAIKSLPRPRNDLPELFLRMDAGGRSGNLVLRTEDLEIGYDGEALFSAEDIELKRLERVALIGANGSGKSTFLKTILGDIPAVNGKIKLGASLKVGYFAQAHDGLNLENTVLEELIVHSGMRVSEARNYLGRFLFRNDDVFKPIKLLSGGERGRMALALLALEGANLLLLDEPTNHLDIGSQEILQSVLGAFDGTIMMVSHDRYLVNQLATQVWSLEGDKLHVFHGNYDGYSDMKRKSALAAKNGKKKARPKRKVVVEKSEVSKNEQRRRQKRLTELEWLISEKESHMEDVSAEMQAAGAALNYEAIQMSGEAYTTAENDLTKLMDEWTELAEHA